MRGYRVYGGLSPSWKVSASGGSSVPSCRSCGRPMFGRSRFNQLCDRCMRLAADRSALAATAEEAGPCR